jgi:hypothetical protein
MFVSRTYNALVPAWIMIVGLVLLSAPPLGVASSLALFMVGVFVIPAVVVIPSAVRARTLDQV